MPRKKPEPAVEAVPEGMVALRLRENAYVRGEFAPGGSVHVFPKAEAEKRLATTQYWDPV